MAKASDLWQTVSEILFREWDPIGVNCFEQARDEYDSYVSGLVELLLSAADENEVASYLRFVQSESMGMSGFDEDLHSRVARRLCALVTAVDSDAGINRDSKK